MEKREGTKEGRKRGGSERLNEGSGEVVAGRWPIGRWLCKGKVMKVT